MLSPLSEALPAAVGSTVVRRIRSDDLVAFETYRSDEVLARYQGWSPMSHAEASEYVASAEATEKLCAGAWVQLAIASRQSDGLIGDVGVFLEEDLSEAEVGFTLSQGAQGQGHASRAVRIVAELIFRDTPVDRIRAITDLRNVASMRLLERTGFRKDREVVATFKGEECREAIYYLQRAVARDATT